MMQGAKFDFNECSPKWGVLDYGISHSSPGFRRRSAACLLWPWVCLEEEQTLWESARLEGKEGPL